MVIMAYRKCKLRLIPGQDSFLILSYVTALCDGGFIFILDFIDIYTHSKLDISVYIFLQFHKSL